jgi:hypothetical protein
MDAETYREATIDTWNTDPPEQYQPANAALGVVGEVRELGDALTDPDNPASDEAGDVLYYLVTLRRLLGLEVASPDGAGYGPSTPIHDLAAEAAEATKKLVFHGADTKAHIDQKTRTLLWWLFLEAPKVHPDGLPGIRRDNIHKLRDRHGKSWTPAEGKGQDDG